MMIPKEYRYMDLDVALERRARHLRKEKAVDLMGQNLGEQITSLNNEGPLRLYAI